MPEPDKTRCAGRALDLGPHQFLGALYAVVKVRGGHEAVRRWTGYLVDIHDTGRVVEGTKEHAARLYIRRHAARTTPHLCASRSERFCANSHLVQARAVPARKVRGPACACGPPSRGFADAYGSGEGR